MGDLANEIEQLERVLFDTRAEPIKISYSVIKSITKGFAQVIGTGGFGVVYLGGLQNGLVAVKKIASKDLSDKEFLDEVTCLRKVKHNNIARFIGYCADTQLELMEVQGRQSLVAEEKRLLCFEYVPNGNLQHYLKEKTHGYEWDTRYQIIKGICRGLHYLHEERIYHLDLKPANVLLGARMEPKITDFGLSRCIDTQQSTIFTINFFGTLGYLAPEFIDQRQISFKSDIFSLGIILIRMLSGNTEDITDNWHESVDVLQCPQVQVCIEVAQSCIDRDPRRRPTISEIIRRLDETETIVQNIPSVISEPVNDPESSLYQVVQRFQQLSTQTVQTRMGGIYAELNLLEHILSGTQKPSNMSSSLLQLITENFSDDRIIGRGGAANVYKGIVQTGMVAVKKLHNAMHISESAFQREIEISMMTEHQNIVRFLGYCSYTEQRAFETKGKFIMADIRERLLCFEYIRNGTLYDHLTDELRGHEWNTRYEILKGICEGIYHLHEEKHVIYLGIKPANILLTDHLVPKLTDFGESRHEDESAPSDIHLYSLGYMAPESMDNGIVSAKSDIYSLGIIIFELVTGKNEEPRVNNVLKRWRHRWNKSSARHSPLWYNQVTRCLELALRCMRNDPTERPSIRDIINELNNMDSNTTESSLDQVCLSLEDMLRIEPLELHFPNESIAQSIFLTNDTDGYFAFKVRMFLGEPGQWNIQPDEGLVPPRSNCTVTISFDARVIIPVEEKYMKPGIHVLSTKVDGSLLANDVTDYMSAGKLVDTVDVMVVLGGSSTII